MELDVSTNKNVCLILAAHLAEMPWVVRFPVQRLRLESNKRGEISQCENAETSGRS